MIALKVVEVKKFMSQLLSLDTFDAFSVQKADIGLRNNIFIDGRLNRSYLTEQEIIDEEIAEDEEYSRWSSIRPIVFQLIKGNRTPTTMNIILRLDKLANEYTGMNRPEAASYYLNIHFEHGELQLITGISYKTFVMDKAAEHEWDEYIKQYLHDKQIACENC